jgi:hypothetical protein
MEIWKDVVGYEGYYEVSTHGNVRSVTRTFIKKYGDGERSVTVSSKDLKPMTNYKGYLYVELRNNGTRFHAYIHRLVANAFIANVHNKPQVNHKDTNKTNNHVDNLEWATNSENQLHAQAHGLVSSKGKGRKAIPIGQFKNGELVAEFSSIADAQRETGISSIAYVVRGERKSAGGYEWNSL